MVIRPTQQRGKAWSLVESGERIRQWQWPLGVANLLPPNRKVKGLLIGDEIERMQHTIEVKQRFDQLVQDKIGDSKRQSEVDDDFDGLFPSIEEVQEVEQDDAGDDIKPFEPESTRNDADDYTPVSMDEYISASVLCFATF